MKFIHSSDLQIGKAFGYFEPEIANILQDARQAVVRTLGEVADQIRCHRSAHRWGYL